MSELDALVPETETAKLNALLAEKQLESSVLKPADAEAYKQRTLANAARDAQAKATELNGRAEALAVQPRRRPRRPVSSRAPRRWPRTPGADAGGSPGRERPA